MLRHSDVALPARWLRLARGYAAVISLLSRLSVRLSVRDVTVMYVFHTRCNNSRPNSSNYPQQRRSGPTGTPPKYGGMGWGHERQKNAISLKW